MTLPGPNPPAWFWAFWEAAKGLGGLKATQHSTETELLSNHPLLVPLTKTLCHCEPQRWRGGRGERREGRHTGSKCSLQKRCSLQSVTFSPPLSPREIKLPYNLPPPRRKAGRKIPAALPHLEQRSLAAA